MVHNISFGLLFSPRYFTKINTYFTSLFIIYYSAVATVFFHFEETLQMPILLTRMKIYNSFVKKHSSSKKWVISLALFLTCFSIDCPIFFALKVDSFGTFYYYDTLTNQKQNGTFYFYTSSDFSLTPFGQILLALTSPFQNLFLSTFVGITLNIVSLSLYRTFVKERREKQEKYSIRIIMRIKQRQVLKYQQDLKQYWLKRKSMNMFKMALTLCSISTLSKFLIIFSYNLAHFMRNNLYISANNGHICLLFL